MSITVYTTNFGSVEFGGKKERQPVEASPLLLYSQMVAAVLERLMKIGHKSVSERRPSFIKITVTRKLSLLGSNPHLEELIECGVL